MKSRKVIDSGGDKANAVKARKKEAIVWTKDVAMDLYFNEESGEQLSEN